jgi:hypothetical protein
MTRSLAAHAAPVGGTPPNPRGAGRLATVVVAGVALLLPLLAGCSKDDGKALPKPVPETTTTTEPIDLTHVSLEPIAVSGKPTSTTRPLGGGKAAILGKVVDADGNAVPGALIRATYYGDPNQPEVIEALSLDDGTYRFEQVLGGRWRIRAWKAPELATLADNVFFLGYSEQRQTDLKVKSATDIVVTSSMAPNPPFTGSPVEVAVLVLSQSVDEDGVVHRSPVGGAAVTLDIQGKWSLVGEATQATEYNGRTAWQLTCTEVGEQKINAIVAAREWPLNVPPCHDPQETTTTTATTSTTLPPGVTTSSTKPKPKTSTSSTRPPSYATTSTRPRSR